MKNLLPLSVSAIAMHYNQDMNTVYWMAVMVMIVSSWRIAKELDNYGRAKRNNRQH